MTCTVELAPSAAKAVRALPRAAQERITRRLLVLAETPRPRGVKKLAGEEGFLRLRVGDYRIAYQVRDELLLVLVVRVGHRREVYRG